MSLLLGVEETPRRLSRRRRSNRKKPPQRLDPLEEFNLSFDKCQIEDDYPIEIPKKLLYPYMEDLLKKKLSVRESALRTLVEEFETNVQSEFARKYFFTLVSRCHNCLKRGSTTEIELALQLIGLVALTLGEGDYAHEIYEDSFVFLPQVLLKSKLSHAVKVMECLSIVTLVGAKDSVDTERSMNFIWEFMSQESKHPSSVAASAISAWALLFSDVEKRSISPKKWKGLIPYLLKQLEEDDEYVNGASIEALALIFD
ncbi:putative L-type lectin-domain containing receptor kinase IX.1-like [Capsicum annuum]|nr:putative L-type lectin-domain containing receptor kinase IX.1-like [Capsicum annuum]